MIKSFKDSPTEDAFNGIVRKGFPADLIKVARRTLRYLHAATYLQICVYRLVTDLKPSKAIAPGNTQSE